MDRTFSTSTSTGGALRQYHHQQYHQSVRNSPLSPASNHQLHQQQQQQQFCRISSSNGITPQIESNHPNNFSAASGFGNISFGNQLGFGGSGKDGCISSGGGNSYSHSTEGSSIQTAVLPSAEVGAFFKVNYKYKLPSATSAQQPQQQQQYYHQQQERTATYNNFIIGAATASNVGSSGGPYSSVSDKPFDHCRPHPLKPNNSRSRGNCGNPTPSIQVKVGQPLQQQYRQSEIQENQRKSPQIPQTHLNFNPYSQCNPISLSTAGPTSPASVPSCYYNNKKSFSGDVVSERIPKTYNQAQQQQFQAQESFSPVQSHQQQHQRQFSPSIHNNQIPGPSPLNVTKPQSHCHLHSPSHPSPPAYSAQMPNNQNNMNKNRYGPTSTAVITPSPHQTGENLNSPASKQMIIKLNQTQQQQQVEMSNEITTTAPSSATGGSPPSANIQNQQQTSPQYRIFKRGDSIPGISSPPIQIGATNNSSPVHSVENGNSTRLESGISIETSGENSIQIQNGSRSDKENNINNVSISGNGGGEGSSANNNPSALSRTPLSQIGEIARFHSLSVAYRLVKETGPPHAPTFTVILEMGSEEYSGEGPSIKKAQHAAATEALEKTSLAKPPPKSKPKKPYSVNGMGGGGAGGGGKRPNWAIMQLSSLAQELQLQLQFVQQPVPIVDPFRRGDPPSVVSVHVGDNVFTGEGTNFNTAKNMAVMVALKGMLKFKQEADLAKLAQAGADSDQNGEMDNKSPISIVHEMAMKRGLTVTFSIVQETGPPHMKVFTVNCKVGEELETEGQGPTKQAAKKASSELMIAKLKEIPITLPVSSQGINLKAMQRGILRQKSAKKKTSTPVVKDLEKQTVSPISRLIQIAHIKKYKEPEFVLISTGTESNVETFIKQITERDRRMLRKKKPVFTIEVLVGPHTCQGTGPNKKAAKKAAAEAAIIALGYGPTEDPSSSTEDAVDAAEPSSSPRTESTGGKTSGKKGKSCNENNQNGKNSIPTVKLAGAKQIAPGIIVLKSEASPGAATSAAAAQEMKKVSGMMTPCPAASSREGIDKLAYLSNLLEISVSYSDFPKKNEYLSVVSLTTNPPHVAHGCGATLEEAQNAAALKILEELSTKGLDSVTAAAEKSTDS